MSPDQTYRDSACSGKVAFSSYAQAQRVAERGTRRGRSRQVYHCPFCHAFHLGRRPVNWRKGRLLSTEENE
jgi:hypothetical protein